MNVTPNHSSPPPIKQISPNQDLKNKDQSPEVIAHNQHLAINSQQWYVEAKLNQRFEKVKLTNKIVYQILGGGVGGNTFLAGEDAKEMLGYLIGSQVFNKFLPSDLQLQLMDCFAVEKDRHNLPSKILAKVAAKSPFVLITGWRGSPSSHAIYLKVTFAQNGQANLRLYNVGAHDYTSSSNHKIKIPPFIDWINIPIENLSNPKAWKSLVEMRSMYVAPNHYGPSDLYQSLKDLLNPETVSFPSDTEIFKAPQDIGNCSWKSLAMLLADHLSGQEYKKSIIHLSLETLEIFLEKQPDPSIKDWRLIEKSLTKLQYDIRNYQEIYKENPASIDYIQSTLSKVKNWLHQNKKVKLTHSPEKKLVDPWVKGNLSVKDFKVSLPVFFDDITSDAQIVKYVPPSIHINFFSLPQISSFVEKLNEGYRNYQDGLVEGTMRAFLQKIDLVTFKEDLPKDQKEIEELSAIYEKFTALAFRIFIEENSTFSPEQAVLMGKLVYIQQMLVQTIYGQDWTFGNMVPAFLKPNEYNFQTPAERAEEQILLQSVQNDYENCFQFNTRSAGLSPIIQSFFSHDALKTDNFLSNVFECKKNFKSEVILNNRKIEIAPEGTQQAHFFSSSFMPLAIQSLRNCILYAQFLLHWKKHANSFIFSRLEDLAWQFEINEKEENAVLSCSLPGLQLGENRIDKSLFTDPEFISMLNEPIEDEINVFRKISTQTQTSYKKIMSSNGWALPKFLDHFYHYPTEIEKADVQKLFSAKLFSKEMNLLHSDSQLFVDLLQWIELSYQTALVNNKIQTCLFMNRLRLQLGCYFSEDLKKQALKNLLELKKRNLEPKELSFVYYEILYGFALLSELNEEQAIELLQASAYVGLYSHKSDSSTLNMDKKVQAVLYQHSTSLNKINLFDQKEETINQSSLNLILGKLLDLSNNSVREWQVSKNEEPVFYTDFIQYQPLTGEIRVKTFSQTLPNDFYLRFKDFQKNFPVQKNLRFNGVYYLFEDIESKTIGIYPHQNGYEIFQNIEGHRYRLLMQDEIKDFQGSNYLKFGYLAWQLVDEPSQIRLIPKKLSDPYLKMELAAVSNQGLFKLISIQKMSKGVNLTLRPTQFSQFEDSAFIHEFINKDNELVEIEFPRFGLTFVSDGQKLRSESFEGYYLVEQRLKILGIFRNYLVIKNDHGELKVLIPTHAYEEAEYKEVLVPLYNFNRDLNSLDPQSYYIFDFFEGTLQSTARENNFYLAATLQINQEYAKCQKILHRFEANLTPFSELEIRNLQQVIDSQNITGDQSPLALANSLKAGVILLKNQLFHQKKFNSVSLTIKDLYSRYLRKLKKIGAPFRLDSSEEIFLIKLIKPNPESIYHLRLNSFMNLEFDSSQIVKSDSSSVKKIYLLDLPMMRTERFTPQNYQNFKEKLNKLPITRAEIKENFYLLYALAKDETVDKVWLTNAMNFMINSPRSKEQELGLALFLREVIRQPDKFPPPPADTERSSFKMKLLAYKLEHTKIVQTIPHVLNYHTVFKPEKKIGFLSVPLTLPTTSLVIPAIQDEYFTLLEFSSSEEQFPAYQAWLKEQSLNPLDSSVQKEWQRLQKDSKLFAATMVTKAIPKKKFEELQTFQKLVQDEIVNLDAINAKQKKSILEFANRGFSSAKEELDRTLWKESQKIKDIKLEQLVINFGQQRPGNLLQLNPALTLEDLQSLYRDIALFLWNSIENQRLNRLNQTLNQLTENNFCSDEALLVELAEHLKPCSYEPKAHPAFMTFEYFSNLRLRPAQIETLNLFLERNDISFVAELIMGSGKSKVLLPLLSVLRATRDDLSILILPESLFESIGQDIQNTLYTILGSNLHSFHFDNQTPLTIQYLEALLDEIQCAKDRQEPLICTEKTLSALLLKFIELSCQPTTPKWTLLKKILSFLIVNGKPLIDEADAILNVTKELMFQQGNVKGVDSDEIHLICAIYQTLYTHSEIKSAFKLESDPFPDPKAPSLTPSLFKEQSIHIAKLLFKTISHLEWSSPEKSLEIQNFFSQIADEKENSGVSQDALSYVCRLEGTYEKGQEFYNRQSKTIQNVLALLGQELSSFLPINLLRNHNEKYGFAKTDTSIFAIPYKSADTPAISSEFSNTHITINYTIQSYLKEGIKKELLENYIKKLQNQALNEMKLQNLKEASILKTQAWKEFQTFIDDLPIPFFNYTEKNLNLLLNKINHSPSLIISFVKNQILPTLSTSEKRLSSNPLLFTALFKQVSGLTGTLWNAGTMHSKLKAEKAYGIESKTLFLLWKNSSTSVSEIQEGSTISMIAQLPPFDLLTDAGAYFKDESNAKMAELIGEKYQSSVIYYNHQGLIDQKGVDPTQTYLDQNHSVGADIKQKHDAIGIVTIGKEMLLRDLLQSVWRLRGLDKNQKVKLVISHEIATLIRDELKLNAKAKIGLKEIISYTVQNQVRRYKEDNIKALRLELNSLLQIQVLQLLLDETFVSKYPNQVQKMLDRFWLQEMESSPSERYGNLPTEASTQNYLKAQWKTYQKKVRSLGKIIPEEIVFDRKLLEKEIKQVIQRYRPSLPELLLETNSELDDTVETTAVAYQETEATTISEVNIEQKSAVVYSRIKGKQLKSVECFSVKEIKDAFELTPHFPLNSYFKTLKEFQEYSQEFDGIDITGNMLLWYAKPINPKDYLFFGSHRVDLHFLLIQSDKMILLSDRDVILNKSNPDLYHIGIGFCNKKQELEDEQKLQLVKIKFLKGEVRYDREDIDLLKKWLNNPEKLKAMETFFQKNILEYSSEIRKDYMGSVLEKMFKEKINV